MKTKLKIDLYVVFVVRWRENFSEFKSPGTTAGKGSAIGERLVFACLTRH